MDVHRQDPIRIRRLSVTNFRTFQGRVDIALGQGDRADAVAVFHGDNGTGKSTAFAALELFFRAALAWLEWRPNNALESLASPWDSGDGPAAVRLSRRDWPPGVTEPMEIEVEFTNRHLPAPAILKARFSQAGSEWNLDLQQPLEAPGFGSIPRDPALCARLRNALEAPNGFRRPFARLDARRIDRHTPQLVEELFLMSTSRDAAERQRWRRFAELVGQFPSLRGKEVSAEPSASLNSRDLVFEERGRLVLGLGELSSGEQQIAAVVAGLLTSRAPIVAIEEPELSLSPTNQELMKHMLQSQVAAGIVDQLLLESHVPAFDGPQVVRFELVSGGTRCERAPGRVSTSGDALLTKKATDAGAKQEWVTPGGYTKLPSVMVSDLGLEKGGHLWFFKERKNRWEAWLEGELEQLLGPGEAP